MSEGNCEIIGENFLWDSTTSEIVDRRDGSRRPDTKFEAKVDVYEDRVQTWFLDIADRLTKENDSPGDYVAVAVALAYVEGVEQFRRGKKTPDKSSGRWFKTSARRIFSPVTDEALNRLWTAVRCGLFHSGFTNGPVLLSPDRDRAIEVSEGYLWINPSRLVACVDEDFRQYIQLLRAHHERGLAKKFESLWDQRWQATEVCASSQTL